MNKYNSILIVDDNIAIHTALQFCLETTFKNIKSISDPNDILKTLAQEEFDIVLLDMNFTLGTNTGQDGIMWLKAIKKRHPQLPVVLLTAYANIQLAVKGMKYGAADFITKPWDNDELTRKLKDAIDNNLAIETLDQAEAEHIRKAISLCHGNLSKAAEMLNISRQTLYNKIKKLEE